MKLKCNKFFIDLYIKCIQISFDLGLWCDTILALKVAIVFNNDSIDHSCREIPRATEKNKKTKQNKTYWKY